MAAYSRDVIENVRDHADIVDVVSGYVPLKRSGRSFMACCPFHEEKTPSFNVSPERRTFKCFGCGVGGSVFDFVMRMERVEFLEALQLLAERYGVPLPERDGHPDEPDRRRGLYHVHQRAAQAFSRALGGSEGAACRGYLEDRGISAEMIRAFGIGYAPGGGRWLVDRAMGAGLPAELLERAGLAQRSTRGPGLRDRFRDRLIFPIRDAQDRVVAFGARTLDGSEPKYLNSPETEIFHKGRLLYGLDRLRQHKKDEPILVMEGYTDVIMATQVGVRGAVATLGTSLTPDHARLLARYASRIVLVYDGDRAGLAAAERGASLLLEAGLLEIEVAVLPEGQDPFDWFRARGPEGAEALMVRTVELTRFLIDRARQRHDVTTDGGRQRAARELLERAGSIADPVARELVIQRIGQDLGVGEVALADALRARRRRRPGTRPAEAPVAPAEDEAPGSPQLRAAQREAVQALVNRPSLLDRLSAEDLLLFPDPRYRRLVETLVAESARGALATGDLVDLFSEETLRHLVVEAILPDDDPRDLAHQLEGDLKCLRMMRLEEDAQSLKSRPDEDLPLAEIQDLYRVKKGPPGGFRQSIEGTGAGSLPDPDPAREEPSEA